jgi:hypothetical protein
MQRSLENVHLEEQERDNLKMALRGIDIRGKWNRLRVISSDGFFN